MKTLLIVTHIDFWRKGAGHRSRLSALLHYLENKFTITVVYAGIFSEKDSATISIDFPRSAVVALEPDRTISFKEHGELFRTFIADKTFDAVLVEYIEMSFVLPMIDPNTLTILDTHDLVADRIRSFGENKIPYNGIVMSEEEELGILSCFDKVLLIQESDYQKIGEQIGFDTAMLVPHATEMHKRELREPGKRIKNLGFVGSEYAPNIDAITWFITEVLPSLDESISLNVYGKVCESLPANMPRVILHGFVDNTNIIYDHCDVMLNPVRGGAGLKIKNIEAMANGVPLITTSHGAIGINEGIDECFLVANSPIEFIDAITEICHSRQHLVNNAYSFIEKKFSPDACYRGLLETILQFELTE